TPFVFSLNDNDKVRGAIALARPAYNLNDYAVEGHLSICGWSVMLVSVAVSGTGVPMAIIVFVLRAKVLAKLVEKSSAMSDKTMRLHRALTKVLTLQAGLPLLFVVGAGNYVLCQSDIVCCAAQEHMIMLIASLIPLISPAITLYYVRPYREFVEDKLLCRKMGSKTSVEPEPIAYQ
ncbi:hypothetical protein PRIPAC_82835, partial [Pristionchus pacificus]|uniref:G protein-coupled receptor n=1 Tax=Pristionchus pacificus TaxID=54126 RepID=A0A2A6CP50_PRIPA